MICFLRNQISLSSLWLYIYYSNILNLPILTDRRWLSGCRFLTSLLTGFINSPSLLAGICFRVFARKTKNTVPFCLYILFSNHLLNVPFIRLMCYANEDYFIFKIIKVVIGYNYFLMHYFFLVVYNIVTIIILFMLLYVLTSYYNVYLGTYHVNV